MNTKIIFCVCLLYATISTTRAQVKIGDNPNTINSNSLLELESTTKGLLAPRVTLNDVDLPDPLTAPIPAGMLVYSTGGTLANGFYSWTGAKWVRMSTGDDLLNTSAKTTDAVLTIKDVFVLASNDITLTLPAITSANNGLSITIKNVGTYTDLVTIVGNGSATIDNLYSSTLTRWKGQTYIAYEGNWIIKEKYPRTENIFDVSSTSSWSTIDEALAFLDEHMIMPAIIRLCEASVPINNTIVIDLPYPVTIQSLSFGQTTISASTGLTNKPMFRCFSECYFKMLMFDASTLTDYGTLAGEDGIHLSGSGTYNEIKDCTFDGFFNAILDSTDAELWLFECDIYNSHNSGITFHSALPGVKFRVSETDFIFCKKGVNMEKGSNATMQLISGCYSNSNLSDIGINYVPATFSFSKMIILNNSWNNIGYYMVGFDFTRTDGRDANAFIESNAGTESRKPHCKIDVLNNVSTTTVTTAGVWVKANWTNTTIYTCKFTINGNNITYQSDNSLDGVMMLSGNVICTNTNKIFSVAIVKNGNSSDRYGETTVKLPNANNPYQWSTNVYIPEIQKNDYFEVWISSNTNSDVYQLQDVQWFTNTQ